MFVQHSWLAVADALVASLSEGVVVQRLTLNQGRQELVMSSRTLDDDGAWAVAIAMCSRIDEHGMVVKQF